jgi:hypothetical protein
VGLRAGLEAVKERNISFPWQKSHPGRPACRLAVPTNLSYLPKKTNEGCKIVKEDNENRVLQLGYARLFFFSVTRDLFIHLNA